MVRSGRSLPAFNHCKSIKGTEDLVRAQLASFAALISSRVAVKAPSQAKCAVRIPGPARVSLDVGYWPDSAELGGAPSRQLPEVHRS
jgi:hypothetical protein